MAKPKRKTETKAKLVREKSDEPIDFAPDTDATEVMEAQNAEPRHADGTNFNDAGDDPKLQTSKAVKDLFDRLESQEFVPNDFQTEIPVNSLESRVGYTSLLRQMQKAYVRGVAYYRSPKGGNLSIDEARAKTFHACKSREEAIKQLDTLMSLPLDILGFGDLGELFSYSPRTAEGLWEIAKIEGRAEFESGHLAANITFPVDYMKGLWNIARYLGVRESFIDDWQPQGGIEIAMIDMLAQSYFQWQYWLEQTVKRSETREHTEHPEYCKWKARWIEEDKGYWFRPLVSDQQALEHPVQMADRFNRIFMRTLRQLRDLRRYAPMTINNANQVNIGTIDSSQLNVTNQQD